MTQITPNDLELIHADLMTANAIINIADGEGTKRNPFLINMIAYHAEQAIEKTMKAVIRSHDPEKVKTAFENAVKDSIDDKEIAKEYKITDEKIDAIMSSHDMALLFYTMNELQPDFEKEHPTIAMNKRRLSSVNILRHGDYSVSYSNAVHVLYMSARGFFKEVESKYMTDKETDRAGIRAKAVVNYSEMPYQTFFDSPIEPTESIPEEDAPEAAPVTAGDLLLIKADLMTAQAILKATEGVRGNLYMANMAAAHAEHAIEATMKAMLKEQGGFEHLLKGHSTVALFNAVASIRPHFAEEHEFLDANKRRLPHINRAVRYGEKGITYHDARGLLRIASDLCTEAEAELVEKTGLGKKALNEAGKAYYESLTAQRVNRPYTSASNRSVDYKPKEDPKPESPEMPEDR